MDEYRTRKRGDARFQARLPESQLLHPARRFLPRILHHRVAVVAPIFSAAGQGRQSAIHDSPSQSRLRQPSPLRALSDVRRVRLVDERSEEHTSELQSHSDLHSFPTRRSSDLYLNLNFFILRAAFFLGFFIIASQLLRRFSVRQDKDGNPQFTIRLRKVAFASLPLFALCLTFGAFDWLMRDRKSTRLNSSHTVIYTLSLHDALPIST